MVEKFIDCTPAFATSKVTKDKNTKVFITVKKNSLFFSRAAIKALKDVASVRVLTSEDEKQVLVMEGENGLPFMKPGKKTMTVAWTKPDLVSLVKSLMPDGEKENVRISGEFQDIDGKKGLLFRCNSIESMRAR